MKPMRKNGHNLNASLVAVLTTAVLVAASPAAVAQPAADMAPNTAPNTATHTGTDTSSRETQAPLTSSSSLLLPRLPSIEVPGGVRDAAGVFGIKVPKRIELDPRANKAARTGTTTAPVEAEAPLKDKVAAHAREKLLKQGHIEDPEAQRVAHDWARQAVNGEATFTGDVGRGTTGLTRGTGNIYRLTPTQALERINYLTRDERDDALETTKDPNPKRFGVATALANDGETIYLVEYFLN